MAVHPLSISLAKARTSTASERPMPPGKKSAKKKRGARTAVPANEGTAAGEAIDLDQHDDWKKVKFEGTPGDAKKVAGTLGMKVEGKRQFLQQYSRGLFHGDPVCYYCRDAEQLHLPNAQRKGFAVFPKYVVVEGYVRNVRTDPQAFLDAKRKNASRMDVTGTGSHLRAGDIVSKAVQIKAR